MYCKLKFYARVLCCRWLLTFPTPPCRRRGPLASAWSEVRAGRLAGGVSSDRIKTANARRIQLISYVYGALFYPIYDGLRKFSR